jgi:precorrin-6B methylase 1
MNLENFKNNKILLLGKTRAFSDDEFTAQLKQHQIEIVKEINDGVVYILEGRVITPYEQNLLDKLYEMKKYEFVSIDVFEKLLAQEIDGDVLLMSLKLSNNKERLKSFLQNSCISNELFFKLLKNFKWNNEDFFENDDNRDVTAALIERFYENIERNHNVQFATTGLIHLISQTDNENLLEVISELEPIKFHPKIKVLLATHPKTPKKVLKRLLKEGEEEVLEAIYTNESLDHDLAKTLIDDENVAQKIAENIALDQDMFSLLSAYAIQLAKNITLDPTMQKELLELDDEKVDENLAKNPALIQENLETLYKKSSNLHPYILQNKATPKSILESAFEDENNHVFLAKNEATPQEILTKLYALGKSDILLELARNENTPVDLLYQMQLDSRFERAVRTNAAFGKHIQTQNIGWL